MILASGIDNFSFLFFAHLLLFLSFGEKNELLLLYKCTTSVGGKELVALTDRELGLRDSVSPSLQPWKVKNGSKNIFFLEFLSLKQNFKIFGNKKRAFCNREHHLEKLPHLLAANLIARPSVLFRQGDRAA